MPIEVIMPKVDMDMASGKVVTCHVAAGEMVAPLLDIETDKAAMEVEAPATGLLYHAVPEGTDVKIGGTVVWLYAQGRQLGRHQRLLSAPRNPPPPMLAAANPDAVPQMELKPSDTVVAAEPGTADKLRATPLARSLAREGAIPLATVTGTGHLGRVQAHDVRAVLDAVPAPAIAGRFAPEPGPLAVTRSRGGSGVPLRPDPRVCQRRTIVGTAGGAVQGPRDHPDRIAQPWQVAEAAGADLCRLVIRGPAYF